MLGFRVALGGGKMFFLTLGDLVPEAEARHVQRSSTLAASVGFAVILLLTSFR